MILHATKLPKVLLCCMLYTIVARISIPSNNVASNKLEYSIQN